MVGQVAYVNKTDRVYVYLGKRVVVCPYSAERDMQRDQRQTVEVWFSNSKLSTYAYLKREPDTIKQKVQSSVNDYASGYRWEDTFRVAEKPNLIFLDHIVEVDEYAIVEHYKPLYQECKGYRSDGDMHRIKYYLCYGDWCRKQTIDSILKDLES